MESLLDVLRWVFTEMLYPRRSTTLRLFALARRDLDIKEAFSIESFQASCAREVTSPTSSECFNAIMFHHVIIIIPEKFRTAG
eukprot:scaffold4326_cov74-Skeletonema_menzelii.AAC.1